VTAMVAATTGAEAGKAPGNVGEGGALMFTAARAVASWSEEGAGRAMRGTIAACEETIDEKKPLTVFVCRQSRR